MTRPPAPGDAALFVSADAPLSPAPEAVAPGAAGMTIGEVDLAMTGLTLSLFVAGLSNLVVLTALPRIVADLHGGQAAYTWIVTASMLAITVCTPIWGRIADALPMKTILQGCVAGYVACSMAAGFADAPWMIILCRIGIGICAAGIIVLMQAISAAITTPRHRARWIGYRSAVMSAATVGAPTVGGFVAEHLGWRWCFFIAVPVALVAIGMVQATLRLPRPAVGARRRIDWRGAILVSSTIITLMLAVSAAAPAYGWAAGETLALLGLGGALLVASIAVELHQPAPMLPLDMMRAPLVRQCVIAATATGVAFFGSAVFLAIYLQIGRGFSPQTAGLMALPEAGSTMVCALIAARFIARHGRAKPALLIGAAMVAAGFGLLSTIGTATPLVFIGLCMALVGGGLGIVSENLVLIVQTVVAVDQRGTAGALVTFFRMVGGVAGVAGLGALLQASVRQVAGKTAAGTLPALAALDEVHRSTFEAAYCLGVSRIYGVCAGIGLMLLLSLILLPRHSIDGEG